MSQQEDEEMSEAFAMHNQRLKEKQKQLAQAFPKRSHTNVHMGSEDMIQRSASNVGNHHGAVEKELSPGSVAKKTGYSWVSGATGPNPAAN